MAEENKAAAAAKRKPRYNFDLSAYRQKQFELYKLLAAEKGGWIISDFVTLGSPIVHAEFLTSDSRADLERSLRERMFSASPPVADLPRASMMYRNAKRNALYPHNGAVFAPTRWTNIYDEHWFPLMGDIVSGRFPEDLFGPGILQQEVTIKRGPLPVFNRFVTHTLYWYNMSGNWNAPSDHIVKLREALDL